MVEPGENETGRAASIILPIFWQGGPRPGLGGNLAVPALAFSFVAMSYQAVP